MSACLLTPGEVDDLKAALRDMDGDGFEAIEFGGLDCDDLDAEIYPLAPEGCDGADNDCDGTTDEGWHTDVDLDGYFSEDSGICAPGVAARREAGIDCDDADASVHPGSDAWDCEPGGDADCNGVPDLDDDHDEDGWTACQDTECDDLDASVPRDVFLDKDGDGYGTTAGTIEDWCESATPSGYADRPGDCDDDDPDRHPETTWHADADADGFGTTPQVGEGCELVPGAAPQAGDCDDQDALVNPGADEVCDDQDVDEDCDGASDDDDTSVVPESLIPYYPDVDADGYGEQGADAEWSCNGPGRSTTDDDCDDTEPAVNPGASEICNDGVDNNCDDLAPDCSFSGQYTGRAQAGGIFWGKSTSDGVLLVEQDPTDIDTDGVNDVLAISRNGNAYNTGGGAVFVLAGNTTGSSGLAQQATFIAYGEGWETSPTDAVAVDIDGDGIQDLVYGAADQSVDETWSGAVHVFSGPLTGAVSTSSSDTVLSGADYLDSAGYRLASGDVDGDGNTDLLSGSVTASYGPVTSTGRVDIWYGPITADEGVGAKLYASEDAYGYGGAPIASADVDGDGVDDVVAARPTYDYSTSTDLGIVFVELGPVTNSLELYNADRTVRGLAGDRAGDAFDIEDLDADGYLDFAVGATGNDVGSTNAGAVYVVAGPLTGDVTVSASVAVFYGSGTSDKLGRDIDAFDLDNDGDQDLALGSVAGSAGTVYIFHGPHSGSTYANAADVIFTGAASGQRLGSVEPLGDANGDGYVDFAMADWSASNGRGEIYLLEGLGM